MDRYVIREPWSGGEFPEGNQMIAFSATNSRTGNNITIPENNMYYGSFGGEVQNANMQQLGAHMLVTPHGQTYSPNVIQAQGQVVSGIDPIYMSAYAENNSTYAQTMHGGNDISSPVEHNNITFGSDYQNRNFIGAEISNRNFNKTQLKNYNYNRVDANDNRNLIRNQIHTAKINRAQATNPNFNGTIAYNHDSNKVEMNDRNFNGSHRVNNSFNRAQTNKPNFNRGQENDGNANVADANNNFNRAQTNNQNFKGGQGNNPNFKAAETNTQHFKGAERIQNKLYLPQTPNVASKKQTEVDLLKHELQNQVKSRAEKLKDLYKSGTRVFSGPVEKIVKWHKSIQDIGVMVFYEIVGKCVNVRAGESCAKNLVVRDENGPAIQVVYYEIDFFLPELKPPCTVRIIGRMMPGTNRFQAFNVRPATGDDVATLPRRAAVAAHHVAKLCKEYGVEVLTLK